MSMTAATSRRLDAFDQWCLRRILRIPYTAHITNEEVRRRTGQPPVTSTIVARRLHLFGHIARADPSQDHFRALQAAINCLPTDWRRRRGQPRQTWLRTIESDLQPTNLGLNSAWLCAQDCSKWRSVVETAMLTAGRAAWWWWSSSSSHDNTDQGRYRTFGQHFSRSWLMFGLCECSLDMPEAVTVDVWCV